MRAAVIGAVGSTAVLLDALRDAVGWEVPIIVTLPTDQYHRHSDVVELAPYAKTLGARLYRTAKTNDPATLAAIEAARPDYLFVVGWSQLCSDAFLALRPGKVIGYHPSALPRLRGRGVLGWTILLDERITAGSLFWMAGGVDDGDLLAQKFFHLAGDTTVAELYDRHMECLREMLAEVLPMLQIGTERRVKQDERFATWATRRTPADGRISWHRSARDIDRLVRAAGRPYPGAFCYARGRKLVVSASRIEPDEKRYHAIIGQIVERSDRGLCVQTADGMLLLTDWEIEGGDAPPLHTVLRSDPGHD